MQDRLELGVSKFNGLTAMLAVDEFGDQAGIQRARPVEGQDRGDVLQRRRFEIAHDLPHAGGLQLEDSLEITASQQLVGLGIIGRKLVGIGAIPMLGANQLEGFLDHGQVLEAEEIHLQQPHGFHVFHEVLGDHLPVVVALQRHQFIEGIGRNHHTSGVHTKGFVGALDPAGHVNPALDLGIAFVFLTEFGLGGVLRNHLRQFGGLTAHHRNQLGQSVGIAVGNIEHPRHILQHGLGGHAVEGDDLRHLVIAVALGDVVDHLATPSDAEIGVDIRHRFALWVEEALKQQSIADWIDVRNP